MMGMLCKHVRVLCTCRVAGRFMRGALLAGGGLGAGEDIGVVAAHEGAAHLRLLLLQHLVQRPLACGGRICQQQSSTGPCSLAGDAVCTIPEPGPAS